MIKPNEQRAISAMLWLKLYLGTLIFFQIIELVYWIDEDFYTFNEIFTSFGFGISIVHLVVNIILVVVFIQWFRRAYYNLDVLTSNSLRYSNYWAALAWFIPIVHWFRPKYIMNEIADGYSYLKSKTNVLKSKLSIWWTAWIIGTIASNIESRLTLRNLDSNNEIALILGIVSTIFLLISGFFLLQIIKSISELEKNVEKGSEIDQIGQNSTTQ